VTPGLPAGDLDDLQASAPEDVREVSQHQRNQPPSAVASGASFGSAVAITPTTPAAIQTRRSRERIRDSWSACVAVMAVFWVMTVVRSLRIALMSSCRSRNVTTASYSSWGMGCPGGLGVPRAA